MSPTTLLERTLAETEASSYLSRVGLRVEHAGQGAAQTLLAPRESHANRAGNVHGGAIATVLTSAGELAAASSERDQHFAELGLTALTIVFLSALRQQEVRAEAQVLRRGRDVVHVRSLATTLDDIPVAEALLVYRIGNYPPKDEVRIESQAASSVHGSASGRVPGSAYMRASGAQVLPANGAWSCMWLPLEGNSAGRGRVHDGAVVGLVDTVGALAAYQQASEAPSAQGATVALSMAWGRVPQGDLGAGARLLARTGTIFTGQSEVWNAKDRMLSATGFVSYRIPDAPS